jgi:hypothetical protein
LSVCPWCTQKYRCRCGEKIESAKPTGVEPRGYLREATLRAVRSPGSVTLARDLKLQES